MFLSKIEIALILYLLVFLWVSKTLWPKTSDIKFFIRYKPYLKACLTAFMMGLVWPMSILIVLWLGETGIDITGNENIIKAIKWRWNNGKK